MKAIAASDEQTVVRHVFPHWSLRIPAGFEETYVSPEGYWHAWDDRRSISLTSLVVVDAEKRAVTAREILEQFPAERGPLLEMPPGLEGWAVVVALQQPARARHAISGVIAVNGGMLLATVTAEDIAWATSIWISVRRC